MMAILSTSLICLALLGLSETTKGCFNQTLQLVRLDTATSNGPANFVQYCLNGQWKWLCRSSTWANRNAAVVCRQLGLEGFGDGRSCPTNSSAHGFFRLAERCGFNENSIEECGEIVTVDNCNCSRNDFATVNCKQVSCVNGEIRLVGGSTNREGRVEVCMDGRWGTVCNNSQEGIAGAVCSQLGFPAEGATSTSTFFRSGPLIHSCTVQDNGGLNCTEITDGSCNHSMDLGVVCKSYQEVVRLVIKRIIQENCTVPTPVTVLQNCSTSSLVDNCELLCPVTKPAFQTTQTTMMSSPAPLSCTAPITISPIPTVSMTMSLPASLRGDTVIALGAAVGLLVALQVVTLTVCIVCCCTAQRKLSTNRKPRSPFATKRNESYSLEQMGSPVYSETTPTQTTLSPNYDTVTTNEQLDTYDVINHSQQEVLQATPANPKSEGGNKKRDDFYDADDHTYSVVDKTKTIKVAPENPSAEGVEEEYSKLQH